MVIARFANKKKKIMRSENVMELSIKNFAFVDDSLLENHGNNQRDNHDDNNNNNDVYDVQHCAGFNFAFLLQFNVDGRNFL